MPIFSHHLHSDYIQIPSNLSGGFANHPSIRFSPSCPSSFYLHTAAADWFERSLSMSPDPTSFEFTRVTDGPEWNLSSVKRLIEEIALIFQILRWMRNAVLDPENNHPMCPMCPSTTISAPGRGGGRLDAPPPPQVFREWRKTVSRSTAVFCIPFHTSFPHTSWTFQPKVISGQVTRSVQVTQPPKIFVIHCAYSS